MIATLVIYSFFFFNDTATTEIYTLSLHDALPISVSGFSAPKLQSTMDDLDVYGTPWPFEHGDLTFCRSGLATSTISTEDRLLRSEEHTSELQSQSNLVCRLLLEKKNM